MCRYPFLILTVLPFTWLNAQIDLRDTDSYFYSDDPHPLDKRICLPDSTPYTGELRTFFVENPKVVQSKMIIKDGYIYKSAIMEEYYPSGNKKSKYKLNDWGEIDGKHLEWFENGKLKMESTYKNGGHDGLRKMFYTDGKIQSEVYVQGSVKQGEEKLWDQKGKLIRISHFNDGRKSGLEQTYYPNGNLHSKGNYDREVYVDPWVFYDIDGKVWMELDFKKDSLRLRSYVTRKKLYHHGEAVYERFYTPFYQEEIFNEVEFSNRSKSASFDYGEGLYIMHCSSCHLIDKDFIGPGLKDVVDKKGDEWLKKVGDKPEKTLESEKALMKKYHHMFHPVFNNLKEGEYKSLLEYIKGK